MCGFFDRMQENMFTERGFPEYILLSYIKEYLRQKYYDTQIQ